MDEFVNIILLGQNIFGGEAHAKAVADEEYLTLINGELHIHGFQS